MEIGTLRFWLGATRYRVLRRCVVTGRLLPLENFAQIADLAAIRRELDLGFPPVEPIQPLPVIDLDTDEEDGPPDEAVNVWHVGPVPDTLSVDRSNFNHLCEIGEFQGDFAAFKRWVRRYR